MKKYFMRLSEDEEENTLFGTLDHWVEVRKSMLNKLKLSYFIIGFISAFISSSIFVYLTDPK